MPLSLRAVEVEVRAKLESLLRPSADAERELVDAGRRHLDEAGRARVTHTLRFARALSAADGVHGSLDAYLSHPFRVARIALELTASPRSAAPAVIGLLHNAYEVCGLDEPRLVDAGYDREVARAIRLLTIDRARETDPGYLSAFYGAIEAHGASLSLVRVVDKMDNLLGLELLEDGPVKTSYLDLAVRFVGPMAARLSPELGEYFAEVARFVAARPHDHALKSRYDARAVGP